MKYRALKSFSGAISMYEGEVKEITESYLINDLTKAGYIMPAEQEVVFGTLGEEKKRGAKNVRKSIKAVHRVQK